VSNVIQSTFRPFWPTSSGPESEPLDVSILLKFLLETGLKSESFDTLDDLLEFWVQKLRSEINKMINTLRAGVRYIRTLISA